MAWLTSLQTQGPLKGSGTLAYLEFVQFSLQDTASYCKVAAQSI